MNFSQPGKWQTATECSVEAGGAGAQPGYCCLHGRQNCNLTRRLQPLDQPSFDPGDFPAQGQKGFLRHGRACHDDPLSMLFLLCSYGFQSCPEESSGVAKRIYSSFGAPQAFTANFAK